jgi:hypothetical protein
MEYGREGKESVLERCHMTPLPLLVVKVEKRPQAKECRKLPEARKNMNTDSP